MLYAKIYSTGHYVPDGILSNEEISRNVDIDPAWVKENIGVVTRHICNSGPGQMTSDLAARAGIAAIKNAGLVSEDIDLIIVATSTPDKLSPSTACIVQGMIGATNAVAFDLNAVCSGFLFALINAASQIESGLCRKALVIGADTFSKITNWNEKTCTFFGDGAGAVVLGLSDKQHFLDISLKSDGRFYYLFTTPHGGVFSIDTRGLYHFGMENLPKTIKQLKGYDTVDHIIPHQASYKLLSGVCNAVGAPLTKLRTNASRYGNTAAATIPILLSELDADGTLKSGEKILFMAMGSGMTWGACIYEW